MLKVGRSDLAARTTLTHTGSLAGSDTLYQALFDRLGVVRVPTPSLMLETLNLLTIAGAPTGQRLAAFTCSGGDVAMLADRGEECGIDFKAPSPAASHKLKSLLPGHCNRIQSPGLHHSAVGPRGKAQAGLQRTGRG
ncbi:MAG: hypothetical protein CM1200mP18_08960 [Gammaproteobacteria bacterium]|nr:MAG: hypothetical protein CM1200mP18_08960 [Gammaproteobacteria bacterium]